MKIRKNLNMFTAQFFKSLQFLYLLLAIVILSDGDVKHFDALWEIFAFMGFMVLIATICGQLYMYFYEKAMLIDLPEPDDVGWK